MWTPASEQEILAAIETGDLIETASFDTKGSLPAKGKSKGLAIDVAAMATDGGTLLYGVGEDEDDRPTVPRPVLIPSEFGMRRISVGGCAKLERALLPAVQVLEA